MQSERASFFNLLLLEVFPLSFSLPLCQWQSGLEPKTVVCWGKCPRSGLRLLGTLFAVETSKILLNYIYIFFQFSPSLIALKYLTLERLGVMLNSRDRCYKTFLLSLRYLHSKLQRLSPASISSLV